MKETETTLVHIAIMASAALAVRIFLSVALNILAMIYLTALIMYIIGWFYIVITEDYIKEDNEESDNRQGDDLNERN